MSYSYQTEKTTSGLFFEQAEKLKDKVFLRGKFRHGAPSSDWVEITWGDSAKEVRRIGAGLVSMGVQKKDRIAIFAHNRPRWILSDQSIQSIGAMGVPIYPTSTDKQLLYILNDCKAKGIMVGDKQLMEQALRVKPEAPSLEFILSMYPVEDPPDPCVMDFNALEERGIKTEGALDEFEKRRKALSEEDVAAIIYTSGTTGEPKGAVLTHKNFMTNIDQLLDTTLIQKMMERGVSLNSLCHLPLCHVYGRTADYHVQMAMSGEITFAESYNKVPENLLEIRPQLINTIPRLYEKIYEAVQITTGRMKGVRKKVFDWALKVGNDVVDHMAEGKRMNPFLAVQFALAGVLVYEKIRKVAGLDRLVMATSGGGALSKDINTFFRSMNIQIAEGYGLTETSPVLSWNALEFAEKPPDTFINRKGIDYLIDTMVVMQSKGKNPFRDPIGALKMTFAANTVLHRMVLRPGTVGRPCKNTEFRIADDGEILSKGPQVFDRDKGYFNRPDLTAEVFTPDGFFMTGDIGHFDEKGFLVITDRKKELLVTAGGKNIAPHPIELDLTLDPYVDQAIVVGDAKKYIAALIVPQFELLEKMAKEKGIVFSNRNELVNHPEIIKFYGGIVEKLNKSLARYEQIKKFRILPVGFSEETGELTPTLKMKRRIIYGKYAGEISSLYTE